MQTHFSAEQLRNPDIAQADPIIKTCQHFGFCTSGCPTYIILHDENDGPRGRIDLIKEMLESDAPPSADTVAHIDRCMSCMSCMTTCAVKVDYQHLVDIARVHIETHYRRPLLQRLARNLLGYVLPRPALFRPALAAGRIAARLRAVTPPPLRHLLDLVPASPTGQARAQALPPASLYPAQGTRQWRVALLAGCVQPVLSPHINDATIRLLTRLGCEVVVPPSSGCCGSLNLHMGKREAAEGFARQNIRAWLEEVEGAGLDAILINASGCGSTVKDYGHMLARDTEMAPAAQRIAALAMDASEWLARIAPAAPPAPRRHKVAYHDACSLRNVQKITQQPRTLLRQAGYIVEDIPEAHFCCGSAGTYNMLQPDMAQQLGTRKAANIERVQPQIIAAGNIGCITQIGLYSQYPIVHTIELLDWAYGGPCPPALHGLDLAEMAAPPEPEPAAQTTRPSVIPTAGTAQDDVGVW